MKKTTNWQWWFRPSARRYYRMDGIGWRLFSVGIIKLHKLPPEGAAIGREDYKGFSIDFMWWFPIDTV
jgi:hypothetical protein